MSNWENNIEVYVKSNRDRHLCGGSNDTYICLCSESKQVHPTRSQFILWSHDRNIHYISKWLRDVDFIQLSSSREVTVFCFLTSQLNAFSVSVIPWHAIGSSVALIFPKNVSQYIYLPPNGLSPCTILYRIPIIKALTVQLQALWHYIIALCTVGGVRGRRFKSYVLISKGYIKRNRGFSVIVELRITNCWLVCLSVQMNA